jgi:spore photoproduct lyase
MVEYSSKFQEHIKKCNFKRLDDKSKEFLTKKAFKYRLSFQDIKSLVDISIDLNMWQEESLADIWEDRRDRKETIKNIKRVYEDIKSKPKSYSSFNPKKSDKKFKIEEIKRDTLGFGECPVASEKTRCCNLLTLDAVESCGFDCSYCSIQSFYNEGKVVFDINFKERLKSLKLDKNRYYHIGTGQSSDSLMWGNRGGVLEALFEFARENSNVILELKTKSDNIDYLLKNDIPKNIITTWSLNPQTIIDNEEHFSASLEKRIESARAIASKGNLVGFHFHPIIIYKDYLKDYEDIVKRLLNLFSPNQVAMVSMGTLTFIKPVIKKLRDRNFATKILQMPFENASGKLSYPIELKKEMFSSIYNMFKPWHREVYFYLCMEEHSLWKDIFGYEYKSNSEMEEDMINSYLEKIKLISGK